MVLDRDGVTRLRFGTVPMGGVQLVALTFRLLQFYTSYEIIYTSYEIKPKCRSWILVFSRKERKDRKAYRDGGLLLDFQAHPLF